MKKNNSCLRKQVRHLMIDADMDSVKRLASEINVNSRSLTMALTGYRAGPASERYLRTAYEFLITQMREQRQE